jgi:hypothetical protein
VKARALVAAAWKAVNPLIPSALRGLGTTRFPVGTTERGGLGIRPTGPKILTTPEGETRSQNLTVENTNLSAEGMNLIDEATNLITEATNLIGETTNLIG